LNGIVELKLEI